MRRVVIVNHVYERDVRVNLSGRQARVAQAFRDSDEVGAVLHHVGCERMPQAVRADLLTIDARQSEPQLYHSMN